MDTAFAFVHGAVSTSVDAIITFLLAFVTLFHFTDKYTQPVPSIVAAIAGPSLYA
jgi:hypothetical protein